jgi:hypothetical protein
MMPAGTTAAAVVRSILCELHWGQRLLNVAEQRHTGLATKCVGISKLCRKTRSPPGHPYLCAHTQTVRPSEHSQAQPSHSPVSP